MSIEPSAMIIMKKISIVNKILEYKKQGYLFHGSPEANITKLEPRPAADTDKAMTFNNDTAVFATNRPEMAAIFAIMNFKVLKVKGTWSVNALEIVTAKIPKPWYKDLKAITGYLYILPSVTFKDKLDYQYKSKVAVEPIEKIPVTLDTFIRLGGKIKLT